MPLFKPAVCHVNLCTTARVLCPVHFRTAQRTHTTSLSTARLGLKAVVVAAAAAVEKRGALLRIAVVVPAGERRPTGPHLLRLCADVFGDCAWTISNDRKLKEAASVGRQRHLIASETAVNCSTTAICSTTAVNCSTTRD